MPTTLTWPRRTARLELRPPTTEDIDVVLGFRNDPELNWWFLLTEVEPEPFRSRWLAAAEDPDEISLVAVAGDTIIGTGGLDRSDCMGQGMGRPDADQLPWHRAHGSIGYMIAPGHAGQGYATEIVKELLALAFGDLGLHRVTAGCFADNIASWRVMEKAGMRREQHGVKDSWHAELGWVDGYTYGVLAEEWRQRRD
jgi:RimJ/RimL family protein N-acetyltransferase